MRGDGNFTESINNDFETSIQDGSVAFADIDNDHDQDLLLAGRKSSGSNFTKLYSNNGSGIYSEILNTTFPEIQDGSIGFADINNDRNQDIFITGNEEGFPTSKFFLNDGKGNYLVKEVATIESIILGSHAFGDIDNDNDLDLVTSGLGRSNGPNTSIYINDGSGNFTIVSKNSFESVYYSSVKLLDTDNDQKLDILLTGYNDSVDVDVVKLYRNVGEGEFLEVQNTPFNSIRAPFDMADIDRDADVDIVIAGSKPTLYNNDGSGNFSKVLPPPFTPVLYSSIAFSDVDGDEDQDLFITGTTSLSLPYNEPIAELYINDGTGYFTLSGESSFEGVGFSSVDFADVDGDDDQDLLVTGSKKFESSSPIATPKPTPSTTLYLNQGNGIYQALSESPFENVMMGSVAFADVDGDGDQDVLITGSSASIPTAKLYMNNAQGIFSEVEDTPFLGTIRGAVAFSDIEKDGDPDLLISGYTTSNPQSSTTTLYVNDGKGNFELNPNTPFEGIDASTLTFSDLDGDEDEDLLITGENNEGFTIAKLYANDGQGLFTEVADTNLRGTFLSSVSIKDIDQDSDMDILVSGSMTGGYATVLYMNNGDWEFTPLENTMFPGAIYGSVAIEDVDGDKKQDIFVSGYKGVGGNSVASLFINQGIPYRRINPSNDNFYVYPNPILEDQINIYYPSPAGDLLQIYLFDIQGKLLTNIPKPIDLSKQDFSLNISYLKPGTYIIKIFDGIKVDSQIFLRY
ncbi:MAG: FG-GAP-like repeat-containing protein [Bacteroidota bacterium]